MALFSFKNAIMVEMAFETKILDTIHCPRCNGMAELRIDQKESPRKWVLVYLVCPICKLNRYSHTTTRKAVKIHSQIKRLKKKSVVGRRVQESIRKLEEMKIKAERDF